jgi:hypothetical protein
MCSMMQMFNKRIRIGRTTGLNIALQNQYVIVVSKPHYRSLAMNTPWR